jgi:hypothetical protein
MKTPVEELFEKLWNTDKDKWAWHVILTEIKWTERQGLTNIYNQGYHDGFFAGRKSNTEN